MSSEPSDISPSPAGEPQGSDFAVIVCAYTDERWNDIIEAIESVRSQTVQVGEIVLVIDHNEELFVKAQAQFPTGVTIVANRHKRGLSGARNTGIESSQAPIVVFLDDDAVAHPDWVEKMLPHYADPEVVGMGGGIQPIWLGGKPEWWPEEFNWVVGCTYKGLPTEAAEIRNPIGANMSVRRSAFEAVGGFSSAIGRVGKRPVGCEETELFIRVRQQWSDSKVVYVPESAVGHKVPAERSNFNYFRRRCFAEGLSKAVVSQLVGSDDGLSSERSYTLKTLPLGVAGGVASGLRGKKAGFGRAGAIVGGLFITAAGYLRGRLSKGPERNLVQVPVSDDTR